MSLILNQRILFVRMQGLQHDVSGWLARMDSAPAPKETSPVKLRNASSQNQTQVKKPRSTRGYESDSDSKDTVGEDAASVWLAGFHGFSPCSKINFLMKLRNPKN